MKLLAPLSFTCWLHFSAAVTLPVSARADKEAGITVGGTRLSTGLSSTQANGSSRIKLTNSNDLVYSTKVKLGGKVYGVQVDTGTSDFWIYPGDDDEVSKTNETSLAVGITYGRGTVDGLVGFSKLEFGSYQVPSQAFVEAVETQSLDALFQRGLNGMLGLSFDSSSSIDAKVRKSWGPSNTLGRTPVSNIFHQNPKLPNFMTVLLGRKEDLDDETDGLFTLSEYVSKYANTIVKQPKLPRRKANVENALTRWNVEMNGLTVNGRPISVKSRLPGVQKGNLVALLDTGFSYPFIEAAITDKIYGSFKGAVKLNGSETWVIPCVGTSKVVFTFAGQQVPIHPLDLTAVRQHTFSDGTVRTFCMNTFQGGKISDGLSDVDAILGASFIKNAYVSFDWGNESDGGKEGPFVQLLATTDFTEAMTEFRQVREKTLKSMPKEVTPLEFAQLVTKDGGAF